MKVLAYLFLLLTCAACHSPCHNYDVMGADEFVIDSYTIRQGKFSILQMEGIDVEELPEDVIFSIKVTPKSPVR